MLFHARTDDFHVRLTHAFLKMNEPLKNCPSRIEDSLTAAANGSMAGILVIRFGTEVAFSFANVPGTIWFLSRRFQLSSWHRRSR